MTAPDPCAHTHTTRSRSPSTVLPTSQYHYQLPTSSTYMHVFVDEIPLPLPLEDAVSLAKCPVWVHTCHACTPIIVRNPSILCVYYTIRKPEKHMIYRSALTTNVAVRPLRDTSMSNSNSNYMQSFVMSNIYKIYTSVSSSWLDAPQTDVKHDTGIWWYKWRPASVPKRKLWWNSYLLAA